MAVDTHLIAGTAGPIHSHSHDPLTYILSDEFEFTYGEEIRRVRIGDTSLYKQTTARYTWLPLH